MPKFMDVHSSFFNVTEEQLAAAYQADLDIEAEEGVHFERAWLDPVAGKVFCLAPGPDKDAVLRIHSRAGHPTDEITSSRWRSSPVGWWRLTLPPVDAEELQGAEPLPGPPAVQGVVPAVVSGRGSTPEAAAAMVLPSQADGGVVVPVVVPLLRGTLGTEVIRPR